MAATALQVFDCPLDGVRLEINSLSSAYLSLSLLSLSLSLSMLCMLFTLPLQCRQQASPSPHLP